MVFRAYAVRVVNNGRSPASMLTASKTSRPSVSLPSNNKLQPDSYAKAVTSLVLSYVENSRSIMLAVVSAKNDFANQIVTSGRS